MKAQELRVLSKEELQSKISDLRKQRMELEFKRKTEAEKPHLCGQVKRDIARILTILKEKSKEA
ncbi:MAG: 50S ribosomal protein L29 [Candidatus Omnitrophica bacterium]|nr:50S ribosomal protein L29 [Candidatus Omnitrophota bacterium]